VLFNIDISLRNTYSFCQFPIASTCQVELRGKWWNKTSTWFLTGNFRYTNKIVKSSQYMEQYTFWDEFLKAISVDYGLTESPREAF
jgi:hypothetical protein